MNVTASIYSAMCKAQAVCPKAVHIADCKAKNTPPIFVNCCSSMIYRADNLRSKNVWGHMLCSFVSMFSQ